MPLLTTHPPQLRYVIFEWPPVPWAVALAVWGAKAALLRTLRSNTSQSYKQIFKSIASTSAFHHTNSSRCLISTLLQQRCTYQRSGHFLVFFSILPNSTQYMFDMTAVAVLKTNSGIFQILNLVLKIFIVSISLFHFT